jgi:hypothetical protein
MDMVVTPTTVDYRTAMEADQDWTGGPAYVTLNLVAALGSVIAMCNG